MPPESGVPYEPDDAYGDHRASADEHPTSATNTEPNAPQAPPPVPLSAFAPAPAHPPADAGPNFTYSPYGAQTTVAYSPSSACQNPMGPDVALYTSNLGALAPSYGGGPEMYNSTDAFPPLQQQAFETSNAGGNVNYDALGPNLGGLFEGDAAIGGLSGSIGSTMGFSNWVDANTTGSITAGYGAWSDSSMAPAGNQWTRLGDVTQGNSMAGVNGEMPGYGLMPMNGTVQGYGTGMSAQFSINGRMPGYAATPLPLPVYNSFFPLPGLDGTGGVYGQAQQYQTSSYLQSPFPLETSVANNYSVVNGRTSAGSGPLTTDPLLPVSSIGGEEQPQPLRPPDGGIPSEAKPPSWVKTRTDGGRAGQLKRMEALLTSTKRGKETRMLFKKAAYSDEAVKAINAEVEALCAQEYDRTTGYIIPKRHPRKQPTQTIPPASVLST